MEITAADCGEKIMSKELAEKITGEIPPTVVEIISWKRLKKLLTSRIVVKTIKREGNEAFYGLRKGNGCISERLFKQVAGKYLYCFVDRGIVYIQMDIDGRTTEFSVPWFVINSLVFDDESSV